VRKYIPHDLMSGDVFIFINKRRDKIKLLMWDSNGFAIWYKELEKGTFGSLEMGEKNLGGTGLVRLGDAPGRYRNFFYKT
jgi:hypothetical protein